MKFSTLPLIISIFLLASCGDTNPPVTTEVDTAPTFQNEGHELVYAMVQKVGDYNTLASKNDVQYTYTYVTADNRRNVSTEKYIFDGELSYGIYSQHERTFPELEGVIEQGYDGNEYWLKQNGNVLTDEKLLKGVAFSRPTNYYWFTMMQKLMDPGLNYEYLQETTIEGQVYDVVKITFADQGDKPTDIYQLYINQNTGLIDQFLFTVADFGKMDTPNLMQVEYAEVDGILLPSTRRYKKSNWNADVLEGPWTLANWTDITFDTGITKEDFKKENTMENTTKTSLKSKLEAKKANFEAKADDNKKRAYSEGIESVENSGIVASAKNVGDMAPNFELTNALGESVALKDYLSKGKVILTWYRGGWCPYCNLTLHDLQQELPNFELNGANLLALTPELPDKSMSTAEKNDLEFEVLSDVGNKVAKEYGIVFELTPEVGEIYNASFDMNGYNGDTSNELPLAATYIIGQDGKIEYAFLHADYRERAEPSELTEFLKNN